MSFWVILLAAFLMAGLVVVAAMLWVGTNAILNGRGREPALTVATLRRALRSVYKGTVRESLPDDFLALLGQLAGRGSRRNGPNRPGQPALN